MIKLNITLPSGAQVAIEADDKDFVREVLYSTMPHLNGATVQTGADTNGHAPEPAAHQNGPHTNGRAVTQIHSAPPLNGNGNGNGADPTRETNPTPANGNHAATAVVNDAPVVERQPTPEPPAPQPAPVPVAPPPQPVIYAPSTPDDHEFIAFCQRVSPLGDMRRVVVAAEAAHRHLGIQSVDPDELERLFTLAGWPIPHSFVQTLRNAARTKFRWLERIPGKAGHYRVTDTGRSIVLGENNSARREAAPETQPDP